MNKYLAIRAEVQRLLKPRRFEHSINVEREGLKLCGIYGVDEYACRVAAILHDCAKGFKDSELLVYSKDYGIEVDDIQYNSPGLLHGPVGAMYAKYKFGIENEDILNSIKYHTTGRTQMSRLEKIIYLADLTEEGRSFPGIDEIRAISYRDLDRALILACNCTLNYIIKNNGLIHPLTVEFRNSLILRGMHANG